MRPREEFMCDLRAIERKIASAEAQLVTLEMSLSTSQKTYKKKEEIRSLLRERLLLLFFIQVVF